MPPSINFAIMSTTSCVSGNLVKLETFLDLSLFTFTRRGHYFCGRERGGGTSPWSDFFLSWFFYFHLDDWQDLFITWFLPGFFSHFKFFQTVMNCLMGYNDIARYFPHSCTLKSEKICHLSYLAYANKSSVINF